MDLILYHRTILDDARYFDSQTDVCALFLVLFVLPYPIGDTFYTLFILFVLCVKVRIR